MTEKYSKGKVLLTGYTGNPGTAVGRVRVINGEELKLAKTEPGEILVGSKIEGSPKTMSIKDYDSHLVKAAGMVQDIGSKACHGNMVAIANDIPSLVGVIGSSLEQATKVLQDGQVVIVEAFTHTETMTDAKTGQPITVQKGTIFEAIPVKDGGMELGTKKMPPKTPVPSCLPPAAPSAPSGGFKPRSYKDILQKYQGGG